MLKRILIGAALAAALAGCGDDDDDFVPRDVTPPAAPRGVYTVTGDRQVTVHWLANTESDVAEYRIYMANCDGGPGCPYNYVTSTVGTSAVVTGLTNGLTRYFEVVAVDRAGNESPPSTSYPFDTPRPEGVSAPIGDYLVEPAIGGYDFSAGQRVAENSPNADIVFTVGTNGVPYIIAAYNDVDIQDAGYASSLDGVDWAPDGGWSPTGSVELITGHNYVVWTADDPVYGNFAKFRLIGQTTGPDRVTLEWAFQTDPGNPELRARKPRVEGRTRRPLPPGL
jgi:hypothetical protein